MFVTFVSPYDILVFIKSNVCCTHSWLDRGKLKWGQCFWSFWDVSLCHETGF